MTKDEAIKLIQASRLTSDEQNSLINQLKNPIVTKEEAQVLIAAINKAIAGLDAGALKLIHDEAQKQINEAYAEYEKEMREIEKQSVSTTAQVADYLDQLKIKQITAQSGS